MKKDRSPIMVLSKASQQICQIRCDRFGSDELASECMQKLGRVYIAGEVKDADLYPAREKLMKAMEAEMEGDKTAEVTDNKPEVVAVRKRPAGPKLSTAIAKKPAKASSRLDIENEDVIGFPGPLEMDESEGGARSCSEPLAFVPEPAGFATPPESLLESARYRWGGHSTER